MRISDWSSDLGRSLQVVDHLHLSRFQSFLIQCSDGNRRGLKRLTSAARCNEDVLNLAASLRGGSGRRGLRQRHTGKRQGNSRNATHVETCTPLHYHDLLSCSELLFVVLAFRTSSEPLVSEQVGRAHV